MIKSKIKKMAVVQNRAMKAMLRGKENKHLWQWRPADVVQIRDSARKFGVTVINSEN